MDLSPSPSEIDQMIQDEQPANRLRECEEILQTMQEAVFPERIGNLRMRKMERPFKNPVKGLKLSIFRMDKQC